MLRPSFAHALSDVEQALVAMHATVDRALGQALRAFDHTQLGSARALIAADQAINEQRAVVEESVLQLIARQQPLSRDLRQCIAALAIATDLERIGDYAAGIATLVLRAELPQPVEPALTELATAARQLLAESITAVVSRDTAAEARLNAADDVVDALYERILHHSGAAITADPAHARHHLHTLYVAHNFERIADRAVNIAERAVWIVTGHHRKGA